MTELLFTEDEWNTAMPKVVADMTAYLRPYRAPIYEHHAATEDDEEHGTGWGSGSYLRLGDKVLILTNEHVSCVRRQNRVLAHQFDGQEDIRRIVGDHVEYPYPLDLALLPVDQTAWANLPQTSGFFFGSSDGTEIADDLAFVAKAREAIAQGKTVYYDSWW